jgi:DinB superfamily
MHSSFEQLHAGYAQLLTGSSAEVLEIHPGNNPERWNARQIAEHLILTYQSSSGVLRERLAKGRPTQSRSKPYQRVQQFFVCRFGYMPTGRSAPPGVVPKANASESLDGDGISARLQIELQVMDELLTTCERQFGEKKLATHQILGPLSAQQWREFHVAHGRHHLKQLRSLGLASSTKEAEIPAQN